MSLIDPIDRNALIVKLGICENCEACEYHEMIYCSWKPNAVDVCEAICDAPTVKPEPKWIPVSERLPEKSGQYYVSGGDKVWICEFLIIPNFTSGWCNDAANPVVQAWMTLSLPKPYRKKGD